MTAPATDTPQPGRSRTGTYVLVLVVHALAITALWAFGRYFGAS
jgi:hypothetical protein